MSFRSSGVPTISLLLVLGCADNVLDNPSINLTVRNDKPVYSLTTDQSARAVLINRGPGTVYLRVTSEFVIAERYEGRTWGDPVAYITSDGVGLSVPILPGDSIDGHHMAFGYVGSAPGTNRFRFFVYEDPETRRLVPAAKGADPAFELHR